MQPRFSNVLRCAFTESRILESNGMPPRSLNQATRTPLKLRSRFPAKREPGSVMEMGQRGSGPAITLNNSAASATVLAIGHATPKVDHAFPTAEFGTRPGAVRKPITLQNAGGFRREPPLSLPSAMGTMPHARLTAAPPLLPPQVLLRSYGFLVAPKTALKVCEPAPNSGVFVLPTAIAPARLIRSTRIASCFGTLSLKTGDPKVVRMPAVSTRSLCATGSPCKGPTEAPRACASSALRAL